MAYYLNSANVDGNFSVQNSKPSSQTKPSSQISPPQSNEGEPAKPTTAPKEATEDAGQKHAQEPPSMHQPKHQSSPQDPEKDGFQDYPTAPNNSSFHNKQQSYPAQPVSASKPPQFVHSHRYAQEDPYQNPQRWPRDQQATEDHRYRQQDNKQARYPNQDSPARGGYFRPYAQNNSDAYSDYPQQQRYQAKPHYDNFSQNQNSFPSRASAAPQYTQRNEAGSYGHQSAGYQGYQPASNYNPYPRPAEDSYKYRR